MFPKDAWSAMDAQAPRVGYARYQAGDHLVFVGTREDRSGQRRVKQLVSQNRAQQDHTSRTERRRELIDSRPDDFLPKSYQQTRNVTNPSQTTPDVLCSVRTKSE